jgi:hypothetical protein
MPADLSAARYDVPSDTPQNSTGEPAIGHEELAALVDGLTQLVEGQRCFADEFGLSYSRVFSDGFEAFKGQDVGTVVTNWLQGRDQAARGIASLLRDLADHQLALLQAVEDVTRQQGSRRRPSLLRRPHERHNDPVPQLVAAYARSRGARCHASHDQGDPCEH